MPDVENFQIKHAQYKDLYIPPTGKSLPIDILIGGDNLLDFVFFDRGCVVDPEHQLMATRLGWLIVTRQRTGNAGAKPVFLLTDDEHIKTMFDLEIIGLSDIHRTDYEEEQAAIDQFYNTIERVGNRYDVGWPYREQTPQLSVNYGLALGCLKSLWKRLRHQQQLLRNYHSIILQQESDDIVEKVTEQESSNPVHYISHHPVIRPEKSTSVRVVYNASGKTNPNEKSLNENILKGRKWLQDMSQIIMRFRTFKTAVTSDIAKAFHQIGIRKQDRDVLRFLWLKNPFEPPSPENVQIYRFKRVAFGVIASPFLLDATISYHLQQQQPSPYIDIIKKDLYADNIVTALPETINPKEFYAATKKVFETMSMNITKWSSNDEELMAAIPADDRCDDEIQSVLGLKWNRINDTLALK